MGGMDNITIMMAKKDGLKDSTITNINTTYRT